MKINYNNTTLKGTKKAIRLALAALLFLPAHALSAQETRTGYFLPDYTYRFQMNPAYGNTRDFFSMPALGNLNVGVNGNLHVSDLFYNVNGRTTTFMNPGVSASEFLSRIPDVSKLRVNTKIDILSFGFKAFDGYNTFSIGVRTDVGINLPKSIFSLLKEGVSNQTYQIGDFAARGVGYAQLALGHSHDIGRDWRIGVTAKFLVGGANVDASLRNAKLTLGHDDWSVTSDAEINASLKGLSYDTDVNSRTNHRYVSGAEVNSPGIGGYGAALDLGVVYKPSGLKDWAFSAAVLDLGAISWNNNMLATTNGPQSFSTSRYSFNFDNVNPTLDQMGDALSALYELEDKGDQGYRLTTLASTVNAGVEYTLPVYRKLSFGLLNTTHINGPYSWTDFRLSANFAPGKVFDAAVSASTGTFGTTFGWLLNLHAPGFNLFLGMDNTVTKFTKDYAPLNSNASLNLGLNFLF